MKIKYNNYYLDDVNEDIKTIKRFNESLAAGATLIGAGTLIGSALTSLYKSYKIKSNSCKNIEDPILNDKCQISVIDNMITELKNNINLCNKNLNPSECKLKLMNKIEELESRRMLYMRNMYRLKKMESGRD